MLCELNSPRRSNVGEFDQESGAVEFSTGGKSAKLSSGRLKPDQHTVGECMPDLPADSLDDTREQRRQAKKTHREQIEAQFRGLIERRGLTYPVRIWMGPIPNDS